MYLLESLNLARTVHIVQRMAPGGIETLVRDLARSDPQNTRIISLEGGSKELVSHWPELATLTQQLIALDKPPGFDLVTLWKLCGILRNIRPDAVINHHIGPLLYGGISARLARIPVVVQVEHDAWYLSDKTQRKIVNFLGHRIRPRWVAVSQNGAEMLRSTLGLDRIRVVPNGVDMNRFSNGNKTASRKRLGLSSDEIVIGSVGRLEPVKGHADLIEAFARLGSANTRLVLVGDGNQRETLKRQADRLGVGDQVSFAGHRDDIAELLPAFDLFVLPSHAEGLPRSIVEAQASGVPVIACNVGGVAEVVCPDTGILTAPRDPQALASAIKDKLNADMTLTVNPSPRAFVHSRFNWEKTVASYRNLALKNGDSLP